MEKPFVLFVTSITETEHFVGKRQINNFGTLFLKIKIQRKWKLDSFLFQGENNSKTCKKY